MAGLTKRKITAVFAFFMATLTVAATIGGCLTVYAINRAGTDYIVKYKECAVWMQEDRSVPFDVVSEAEMKRLDQAGLLEWYEPDGEMILLDEPAIPMYPDDKWDFELISADVAFENNYLGQNVRIGVIDSGINPHKDIAARLIKGQSYIENSNANDTADTYGHGTHVAGLIAGSGENGYIGAAPEAELVPLKVTDGKGVSTSTVCKAIYGGIKNYHCDILNLSLGIYDDEKALKEAVEYAEECGVVVVSAVGNSGSKAKLYPAAYSSVIGVGAVDSEGVWFYHSNHNDSVFITAPGVNVYTIGKYGGYELKSGASFSVPLVTAAAAVMLSIDNTLTPQDIMTVLAGTALDKGDAGYDEYYGAGILDIGGCVGYLTRLPCRFLPASGAASQIQNTASEDINCTYFLTEYGENGALKNVVTYEVLIPAKGIAEVETPQENTNYGQFVWMPNSLKPLANARKSH